CTDDRPPDGDGTFVSTATIGARQSFCLQPASVAGVFGDILAVKSLVLGRGTPSNVGMTLRLNSPACGSGSPSGATSDTEIFSLGTGYGGVGRVDVVNPAIGDPF